MRDWDGKGTAFCSIVVAATLYVDGVAWRNALCGALCDHDWQLPIAVIGGSAFRVLYAVPDYPKERKKAVIFADMASKFPAFCETNSQDIATDIFTIMEKVFG